MERKRCRLVVVVVVEECKDVMERKGRRAAGGRDISSLADALRRPLHHALAPMRTAREHAPDQPIRPQDQDQPEAASTL